MMKCENPECSGNSKIVVTSSDQTGTKFLCLECYADEGEKR